MTSSTRWCAAASPATITRWTSCSATTRAELVRRAQHRGGRRRPGARRRGSIRRTSPSRSGWPAAWPGAGRRRRRRRRAGNARAGWRARAMARAATRQAISRTDSPSQVTATRCAVIGVRSRALSSRKATTVVSVAAWKTAGASSRVLLRRSSSSRRYSPDVVLITTISGSRANAVAPGPVSPKIRSASATTSRPASTSAATNAPRKTRSRWRTTSCERTLDQQRHAGCRNRNRGRAPSQTLAALGTVAIYADAEHAVMDFVQPVARARSRAPAPVRASNPTLGNAVLAPRPIPTSVLGYPDLREELQACQLKCSGRPMYGGERKVSADFAACRVPHVGAAALGSLQASADANAPSYRGQG